MKLFRFTAMLILGLTVFLTVVILSVPYDGEGVPSAPDEPQPGSSEPTVENRQNFGRRGFPFLN